MPFVTVFPTLEGDLGERRIFHTRAAALRALCIAVVLLCSITASLLAQYREIPLPYRDTTRVKVQFLDSLHGWVVNHRGTILRTTDGGVQWTEHRFTADTTIDGFEFVDRSNGWLLVVDGIPREEKHSTRLYATRDAGEHWDRIPFPDTLELTQRPSIGYWSTPFSRIGMYRNMDFVDSTTVYIEAYGPYGGYYRRLYSIWRTTNRGATWERAPVPPNSIQYSSYDNRHLEVIDPLNMFIVYSPNRSNSNQNSYLERTSDGGTSWETIMWRESSADNVIRSDDSVYFIYLRSNDEFTPLRQGYTSSTDGGKSWEVPLLGPRGPAKMAYFMPDSNVWSMREDSIIINHFVKILVDGSLYTTSRDGQMLLRYPKPVRWLSKAGRQLFVLTAEGRLIVFDFIVGVESPQYTEESFRELTVYPNPARENVHVLYPTADRAVLVVSDLHGRILFRHTTQPGQPGANKSSTISIRDYPPGVYHLQISTASTRQSRMILKY